MTFNLKDKLKQKQYLGHPSPNVEMWLREKHPPAPPLPYDAEVKWIEGSGTQYIDTGIAARDGLLITTDFCYFQPEDTTSKFVFGGGKSVSIRLGFMLSWSSNRIQTLLNLWILTANNVTASELAGQNLHVVMDTTSGAKYASINGTTVATSSSSSSKVDTNGILLFAYQTGGNVHTGNPCRISYFSVKDTAADQLLVDFISVRFTNELGQNEGAMYDKVSGQLFRNDGADSLVIGPDK